ncbi:MAG: glycosyltransferase family 4 protein [Janthinobacterium lividum]
MKLLLMTYECSPYQGSEWAAGWGRVLGAAKVAETHVVTSQANQAALAQARAEGLLPANVFVYAPVPDAELQRLERKRVLFAYNYRAYHHWQVLALKLVKQLHAREKFDLVHQVNVCTFREPGYGWQLDIPMLWGPVGGTQNFPGRFLPMLSPMEAAKEGLRTLANWLALRNSRVREAAQHAAVVFAANSTNRRDLANAFDREVELLLETGLHEVTEPDRTRFEKRIANARSADPLRILWSGELQTRKALPILLRALAQLPIEVRWQLDVLGDGPLRGRWSQETEKLGLSDRVRFLGRLPFAEAVAAMRAAELFCFTSLRDTSGNVVLEALAAGVPVLCFDHQGAGDMVSDFCGIKLPVDSPQRAYGDWAQAIQALASDPRRLFAFSRGATVQARHFLWSRNHDRINAVYRRLSAQQTQQPFPGDAEAYDGNKLLNASIGSVSGSPR